jgi:LasA protease
LLGLLGCNLSLAGFGSGGLPTEVPPTFTPTTRPTLAQSTAFFVRTQVSETAIPIRTNTPKIIYYTQSGDTQANLLARFNVKLSDIASDLLPADGFLRPGQMLVIPDVLGITSQSHLVLPDSEVIFSPSTLGFDINAYVKQAGGFLFKYTEYLKPGLKTGAEVVQWVASDHSLNPRLLLALLEYQSHWVTGQPGNLAEENYPMGFLDVNNQKLFAQLSWAARQLDIGYYGWRAGTLTRVTFPDGTSLRLAPEINAGTAALGVFFANFLNQREWAGAMYGQNGFSSLFERLFGPFQFRAQEVEPLFPPDIAQPPLDLPFFPGQVWSFSGGPHAVWGKDTPFAALDFAPGSTESGCAISQSYVLAPAAGVVTRSGDGIVVLDLDGDGHEQTGWVLLFLHIRTENRAPVGARLNKDDPIGHPSCEGGSATGTHVHIARKYNGEWLLADGPLPFVLSGWRAFAGEKEYLGTLKKNDKIITAATNGSAETQITRSLEPGP